MNTMTEFNYPEYTTSITTALSILRQHNPKYRADDTQSVPGGRMHAFPYRPCSTDARSQRQSTSCTRRSAPRACGSGRAASTSCMRHGSPSFDPLSRVGQTYENSASTRQAANLLIRKQRADGGWNESYKMCPISVLFANLYLINIYFPWAVV